MQWRALLMACCAIQFLRKPGITPGLMIRWWAKAGFWRRLRVVGMCPRSSFPVTKQPAERCARCLAPKDACSLIEMNAAQALSMRNWPKPYKVAGPVTFKVELATPDRVHDFVGQTGVRIEGPRTVTSTADTFWQAWDQFWYRR